MGSRLGRPSWTKHPRLWLIAALLLGTITACPDDGEEGTDPTADSGALDDTSSPDATDTSASTDGALDSSGHDASDDDASDLTPDLIIWPDTAGLIPEAPIYAGGCSARVADELAPDTFVWRDVISTTGCVTISVGAPPELAEGLIPYTVRSPLFSDNADKWRALGLPADSQIGYDPTETWTLPEGAHLLKTFEIDGQVLETRFLVLEDGAWEGATYRWNSDHSEATLVEAGTDEDVEGQIWYFPGPSDCDQCHTRASGRVLGLRTEQFFIQSDMFGLGQVNQVAALDALGYFEPPVPQNQPVDMLADYTNEMLELDARARSYLTSNCAHCHQPGGSGFNSVDLRSDRTLAETNTCDVYPLGTALGLGADARIIAPGVPENSVLLLRMESLDFDKMPPLGHNVVDDEGVALIRAWIERLEGCE